MSKIITITANTAIDSLVIAQTTGAQEHFRFPAGKGINVSRTVEVLGGDVVALGFVGESEEKLFAALGSKLFHVQLIPVGGVTRTNTTTFNAQSKLTDHQRTQGYEVAAEDLARLLQELEQTVEANDIVVISGSCPRGPHANFYRDLIAVAKRCGSRAILDSSNGELLDGIRAKPFLVKPNIEELAELLPARKLHTESDVVNAAFEIWKSGVEVVVVSRAAEGVIVVCGPEPRCYKASVRLTKPASPTGNVGSGDALVGGIAFGLLRGWTIIDAVRLGTACGAANVLTLGPGICHLSDIELLNSLTCIEDLTPGLLE